MLGSGAALAAGKAGALRVCYDEAGAYPWVSKTGSGLNVVLTKMAARELGLKFEAVAVPWTRCLDEVKAGRFDGVLNISYKAERKEIGQLPMKADGTPDAGKRLNFDGYTLYRKKGANLDWDGSKFRNLSGPIATQSGFSVVDQLKSAGAKVDDTSKSPEEALRQVLANKAQGAALQTSAGQFVTNNQGEFLMAIEKVPIPLVEKAYFLMLSHQYVRNYPDTARDLWATIESVRESSAYKNGEAALMR